MSDATPSQTPLAGWYPDPEHPGFDRWWDGYAWSEARRGLATATPFTEAVGYGPGAASLAPITPAPRNTLALVGLILSLSGIVIPIVLNSFAGGVVSAIALRRSKALAAQGVLFTGRGLSFAGILVGFIWGAIMLIVVAAIVAFALWIAAVHQNFQFSGSPVA
jgi:hypothetical protein